VLGYLSQVLVRVKAERIFLTESAFWFREHSKRVNREEHWLVQKFHRTTISPVKLV
jgi:hypothetical protein